MGKLRGKKNGGVSAKSRMLDQGGLAPEDIAGRKRPRWRSCYGPKSTASDNSLIISHPQSPGDVVLLIGSRAKYMPIGINKRRCSSSQYFDA